MFLEFPFAKLGAISGLVKRDYIIAEIVMAWFSAPAISSELALVRRNSNEGLLDLSFNRSLKRSGCGFSLSIRCCICSFVK